MTDVPILPFVEDPPAPEFLNILTYGPTGCGKSTGAATADGPILWVNADGPNSLAYARKTARERGTKISELRIEPGEGDVRELLREIVRYVKGSDVKTVVVDTVAKVREALIAQLVEQGARNTLQQYGQVAKALGGFVRVLRDAPVNLVLICHEDIADQDGDRIIRPLIGGSLTETIPGEMDIVAYCRAVRDESGVRYLGSFVENNGRRAKDRSGGLGAFRPINLSEWREAFREALDASPVPFDPDYQEPAQTELVGADK